MQWSQVRMGLLYMRLLQSFCNQAYLWCGIWWPCSWRSRTLWKLRRAAYTTETVSYSNRLLLSMLREYLYSPLQEFLLWVHLCDSLSLVLILSGMVHTLFRRILQLLGWREQIPIDGRDSSLWAFYRCMMIHQGGGTWLRRKSQWVHGPVVRTERGTSRCCCTFLRRLQVLFVTLSNGFRLMRTFEKRLGRRICTNLVQGEVVDGLRIPFGLNVSLKRRLVYSG
jgi:hypothetical protein